MLCVWINSNSKKTTHLCNLSSWNLPFLCWVACVCNACNIRNHLINFYFCREVTDFRMMGNTMSLCIKIMSFKFFCGKKGGGVDYTLLYSSNYGKFVFTALGGWVAGRPASDVTSLKSHTAAGIDPTTLMWEEKTVGVRLRHWFSITISWL